MLFFLVLLVHVCVGEWWVGVGGCAWVCAHVYMCVCTAVCVAFIPANAFTSELVSEMM